MITRIEGMADNHALVFARSEDGYWTAEVPPDLEDGTYYVTLTAWDAAGNSTYYATILLMVDAGGIRIAWQDGDYLLGWMPGYNAAWDAGYCADVRWMGQQSG